VLTAADVLRSMPQVCSLWEADQLSWGQVRNIALKAARRSLAERETLDRRLAATEDLDAYGPDGLLDAVDRAIDDVRATREVELEEAHQDRDDFLWTQATSTPTTCCGSDLAGTTSSTTAAGRTGSTRTPGSSPSNATAAGSGRCRRAPRSRRIPVPTRRVIRRTEPAPPTTAAHHHVHPAHHRARGLDVRAGRPGPPGRSTSPSGVRGHAGKLQGLFSAGRTAGHPSFTDDPERGGQRRRR
jgi:hypothetical protein